MSAGHFVLRRPSLSNRRLRLLRYRDDAFMVAAVFLHSLIDKMLSMRLLIGLDADVLEQGRRSGWV
jgi:hypothetical protein